MIRPWYRSRLFWLGLPGLVFMLWLWLANAGQGFNLTYTGVTGPAETTTRSIVASGGSVYQITYRKKNNFGLVWPPRGFYWRWVHGPEVTLEPVGPFTNFPLRPFGIIREAEYLREFRQIRLAWWAVISAYTAVWWGTVAGWQHRKARLIRRAAAIAGS